MGRYTLDDAVIAKNIQLEQIASEHGVFATAEATTMFHWRDMKRADILQQIAKTRRELQRLDQSLLRLESLMHRSFGKTGGEGDILREYVALEGWSLTLMANYISLAALEDEYGRENGFQRAANYLAGAIAAAKQDPKLAATLQQPVRDFLTDMKHIR